MPTITATASEARANFSQIASQVSKTGTPVTVFKNSRPWVQIVPSNYEQKSIETQSLQDSKSLQSIQNQSAQEAKTQKSDYISIVASALRESKQQFEEGKYYENADTLINKLAQERPEIWK